MEQKFISVKVNVCAYENGFLDLLRSGKAAEEFAVKNGKVYETFCGHALWDRELRLEENVLISEFGDFLVEYTPSQRGLARLKALMSN